MLLPKNAATDPFREIPGERLTRLKLFSICALYSQSLTCKRAWSHGVYFPGVARPIYSRSQNWRFDAQISYGYAEESKVHFMWAAHSHQPWINLLALCSAIGMSCLTTGFVC